MISRTALRRPERHISRSNAWWNYRLISTICPAPASAEMASGIWRAASDVHRPGWFRSQSSGYLFYVNTGWFPWLVFVAFPYKRGNLLFPQRTTGHLLLFSARWSQETYDVQRSMDNLHSVRRNLCIAKNIMVCIFTYECLYVCRLQQCKKSHLQLLVWSEGLRTCRSAK